jgi:hypothetical protein
MVARRWINYHKQDDAPDILDSLCDNESTNNEWDTATASGIGEEGDELFNGDQLIF